MTPRLYLLIALALAATALPALAGKGDRDIGDEGSATPLDDSASKAVTPQAQGQAKTSPLAKGDTKSEDKAKSGDRDIGEESAVPPVVATHNVVPAVLTPPAKPELPMLPGSVQSQVTQAGQIEFNFDAEPIESAMRQLGRHSDRPIHLSFKQSVRISGIWKDLSVKPILVDICKRYGLRFTETNTAYTLDDNASPLVLPEGQYQESVVKAAASEALSDALSNTIILVEPKNPAARAKADKEFEKKIRQTMKDRMDIEASPRR